MASLREPSKTAARPDAWGCRGKGPAKSAWQRILTFQKEGRGHTAQCTRQWTAPDHVVETREVGQCPGCGVLWY